MKYLHTMLRISDIDSSIKFYCGALGLQEIRRIEVKEGKFTLIFLAAEDDESSQIELTYNWDTTNYELGNGFGHLAIEVDDVYLACDRINEKGGKIVRPAGPMKHGKTILAFVKDPDGYMIELLTAKES